MEITLKRFIAVLLATLMVFLNGFSISGYAYGATDENAEDQTIATQSVVDGDQAQEPEADAEPAQEPEVTEEQVAEEEQKTVTQEADVEEVKEVAFSQEKTVDGVNIKVTADKGVFPEGATLTVKKLNTKEAAAVEKAIGKISGEIEIAKQYNFDITILDKDGNEIQPEGKANVAFKTSEVADDSLKTEVYHIGDSGKAEAMDVAINDDKAVVETEGFSNYSIRFTYYDEATGKNKEIDLAIGSTLSVQSIADALGFSDKTVERAHSEAENIIHVDKVGDTYYVRALAGDPDGTHGLEIYFTDNTKVAVTVRTHTHNWDLSVDGAKATLKCTAEHCVHTDTYTKTISASDVTYDGNPHGASLSGTLPSDVTVGDILYASGSSASGGSTTAPKNAGTYTAYINITPHPGTAKTISVTYTIKKADPTWTAPTAKTGLVYDGNSQALLNAGTANGGTMKYYIGSSTAGASVPKEKDAGEYTVNWYVEGDSNHNDSAKSSITVTIAKRPVEVSGIDASNKIYDSKTDASMIVTAANISNVVDGEALKVTAKGNFADKNVGTEKAVTYTLTLKADNDSTKASNYTVSKQNDVKADITWKHLLLDWDNATELQYTGKPQAPTAIIKPGDAATDTDGKVYKGDTVKVDLTEDSYKTNVGGPYEAHATVLSGTDAGNYYLDDHNSNVGAKFSIVPRVVDVIWAGLTKEYNAKIQAPTVSLNDDVAATENVSVELIKPTDAKNAGVYNAVAQLTGEKKSNFTINPYTSSNTFTITKAPLVVEATGWLYYGELIGEIKDPQYKIISGLKEPDTEDVLQNTGRFETDYGKKYERTDLASDPATGVPVKTASGETEQASYYLLPVFENADNYEIINEDGELTVYPKPVKLAWTHTHAGESEDISEAKTYVYDGKKHTYTAKVTEDSYVKVNGHIVEDEIEVILEDNVERDACVKKNHDKYTAKAMSLSNPNYALFYQNGEPIGTKSIDFTINQLPIELSWSPTEFTYNAAEQKPEISIVNLQTNDEGVKDSAFEIDFDTVNKAKEGDTASINAGEWKANANIEGNQKLEDLNYTIAGGKGLTQDYTIKKAPLTIKADNKTITYGDTAPSEYSFTVSGLKGEDTKESIGFDEGKIKFTCPYAKFGKPGIYTITGTQEEQELDNYEVILNQGDLYVNDNSRGLVAKGIAKGKNKGVISWNGVTGATSYEVYLGKCNKKGKAYKCKKVATVKGNKYTTKKLKKNTFYKFYVVAKTPSGNVYSSTGHFATGNKAGKLTNAKSLSVRNGSVSLSKGGKYTIGKSSKKAKKKLKWPGKAHGGNYRFMSDNTEVATVNRSGTITAVGSGWCRVYVQTTNGIWRTVQVYVG